MLFNPLDREITRELRIPLYYTGLTGSTKMTHEGGESRAQQLTRTGSIDMEVTVAAGGYSWFTFE